MQNAGQYVPGTAIAHPPQQFVPSEPSPNGGSTTTSLRQFRKRDVDKSQQEQSPKQESHVARVAPHNHYPPVSNDLYRYPPHQFSDYSSQLKYSDIADASQSNPISTSVIQKPKPKDYMEMCNVQQQHLNNQQQYSPDNGPYMHRDHTQGYPTGYKPEAHYLTKDQHQYQQLASHHNGQTKMNSTMTQNMRKYNPGPDNPFLNKLSKIHPSMARSIISDHHMQEPQPNYSPIDQRGMYGQQNHRYYTGSLHQPNPYGPNPNYPINPSHHYPNYPSASCSYPRTPQITPRYSHMERSMSPTRRGYPENMHMNHLPYQNIPHKMQPYPNYSLQYAGTPEYAQHYQHRRMGQDCYPQPCRPPQFMQSHQQMPTQEMQEHPESRISPSDSLKKFIENWAADEEPVNDINPMDVNMNLRDNLKVRDDAPPGTVYMINATDVQYFENNGIPIVTSDNGGIQLTSENYQYLLKNGLVDNSGMVRIIEANKEISIDSSGNHERIVNLQIMETSKSDCMMVNKSLRPSDGSIGPNGILPKVDDERRVVIHQNTVISPGNSTVSERISSQRPPSQAAMKDSVLESTSISKELVDKNCSPINLDQLEHNLGFSEPDPSETENDKHQNIPPISTKDSNVGDSGNAPESCKQSEISLSDDLSQNSDDSQNKSPGSKSMPIIDLFGDSQIEENDTDNAHDTYPEVLTKNEKVNIISDENIENLSEEAQSSKSEESNYKKNATDNTNVNETDFEEIGEKLETKEESDFLALIISKKDISCNETDNGSTSSENSVSVTSAIIKSDRVSQEENNCSAADVGALHKQLSVNPSNNKEVCNIKISEPLNNNQEQLVLENLPIFNEVNQADVSSENVEDKNKTKRLEECKTQIELTPVDRRKRIFSVDDIMNHIGSNIKRGSTDLDIFCSTETLQTFLDKEVEFSSLEQTINLYYLHKKTSLIVTEDISSLDNENITEIVNSKNLGNAGLLEDNEDCQKISVEYEKIPDMEDSDTSSTTTKSSIKESRIDEEERIRYKSQNKVKQKLDPAEDTIQSKPTTDNTKMILDKLHNDVNKGALDSTENSIRTKSTIDNTETIYHDKFQNEVINEELDSTVGGIQTDSTTDNQKMIHDDELQNEVKIELGSTEAITPTELTINRKEVIQDDNLQNEPYKEKLNSTEDSSPNELTIDKEIIDDKLQTIDGEEDPDPTEDTIPASDSSYVPIELESDERSSTPSVVQYQNAIRIEESSVLLQIAGELMEINVSVVNGKKVITVVPLSETTVVDYNDNYEISGAIQDTDAIVPMDSIRLEPGNEENAGNVNEKDDDYINKEMFETEQNIALLENQKEIADTVEENANVVNYDKNNELQDKEKNIDEGNKKVSSDPTEEKLDLVEPSLDSEEHEFDISDDERHMEVETEHIISCKTNQLPETDKFIVGDNMGNQEIESKSENETQIFKEEQVDNIIRLEDLTESEVVEGRSELTNLKIIETCENSNTSIQATELVEVNNIEEFVAEEFIAEETVKSDDEKLIANYDTPFEISDIAESNNMEELVADETVKSIIESNSVQIDKNAELIIDSEHIQLSKTIGTLEEKIEDTEIIESSSFSTNFSDDLTGANAIILGKENIYDGDVTQASEMVVHDTRHIEEGHAEIQDDAVQTIEAENIQFSCEELCNNTNAVEDDSDNEIDTESFSYPLEDDVFITAEPSNEIIVSDPLEGVALIEEVDKTSDSFDIPLEPVTASDDIVKTSEVFSTEELDTDEQDEHNDGPIEKVYKPSKDSSKDSEQLKPSLHIKEEIVIIPDLEEKVISEVEKTPVVKIERTKELIIKISKPEVQILSPTSTNIEDPITQFKENIYLEPRRRFTTDDVIEPISVTITTKAAKKLYECDLQIPAVTTSGDISTKVSKKLMKCQHDTVSSSKKDRIVKDLSRNRKSVVKRSKRINEKNKIKNEQKEMLRLIAEKRKQKKETKQKEENKQKEECLHTEETKATECNLTKPSILEEIRKAKHKHSLETDDEYVDFKELLRARKMKKLKKMQELKRREAKDKVRSEEGNKNVKDCNKSVASKKGANVNKPNIVSSSHAQGSKIEVQTKCCVGCNRPKKKSTKDDNQKSKKRKNSSDEIKALKVKSNSSKTEISTSDLEAVHSKLNIVSVLSAESRPNVAVAITKADVGETESTKKPDFPAEVKCTDLQSTGKIDNVIEESLKVSVPHLDTIIENNPKKIKLPKRVSFCDDISSSTSHNETFSLSMNDVSLKMKTSLNQKDPRRRSKGYAGPVMVPSVSELIEENSGGSKKKISLADYVSRKRINSTDKSEKAKPEEKEFINKKTKLDKRGRDKKKEVIAEASRETESSSCKSDEYTRSSYKSDEDNTNNYKSEEANKNCKKTLKDVKTSFVIHSSDWEDSQSPLPTIIQSNDECLIEDFSGLIKSKSKPVIDVNELTPLETLDNPKDKKLQEYKDKVDSQLSSLNIQIPKIKPQNLENKWNKLNFDPYGSPESSFLIKKLLSNEKITESEMVKIKKIISYKRLIQHQKNARSPSKSPGSSSSTYSQSPACSSYEPTCLRGKSPINSESAYSASPSEPIYEIKNHRRRHETDSKEMRLHLKKNAKRKLNVDYEDESSSSVYSSQSENRHKKTVDYSVINRLGKDGLPKIIFKRNRQSNISDDNQLVVALERIDNNLELVEEQYKVTVRR